MKAITPVVSLIMLVLITVGLVGASWLWISGIFSGSTDKAISIPVGAANCINGRINVNIVNNGNTNITAADIVVADVDGTPTLGNGLAGYWKLDEGGGSAVADSSGNGYGGALGPACPNCPSWTAGKAKAALNFDGVDDSVIVNSNLGITNGDITIFARFKAANPTSPADHPAIVSHYDDSAKVDYRIFQSNTGVGVARHLPVVSWEQTGTASVSAGSWHNIALVYSGTTLSFYLDGVLQGGIATSGSGSGTYATQTKIGEGTATASTHFNGVVDDVRIYNRALSPEDVRILSNEIGPGYSNLFISYLSTAGRHAIRIGTSANIARASVDC